MNRNQKIALGCGGAGCLGLIVVLIAAGLIYFFAYRQSSTTNRDYDFNTNVRTNRNSNSNDNSTSNDNDNSSSTSSASSMSEDDKHKLYQAAAMTGDPELLQRISVKIGLMDEDFTPGANYQEFVQEHVSWVIRNTDFIQSVNTQEKARAYVNDHFPD